MMSGVMASVDAEGNVIGLIDDTSLKCDHEMDKVAPFKKSKGKGKK